MVASDVIVNAERAWLVGLRRVCWCEAGGMVGVGGDGLLCCLFTGEASLCSYVCGVCCFFYFLLGTGT